MALNSFDDLLNWDNFRAFIRENNNVTWRNFNVEDNDPAPDPDTPKGFSALGFLAPGAFDMGRRMHLEVMPRLPGEAQLELEMPLARRVKVRPNHYIERTSSGLRPPSAAHVKR